MKGYEVWESTSSGFTTYTTYFTSSMSYSITGKGDGTYYYKVYAVDNAGNRDDSNTVSVTVALPPPPPPIQPAPPWGVIDDFTSETGTADQDGEALGDWTYFEAIDEGNYVTKVSSLEGRSGVGLFHWDNNGGGNNGGGNGNRGGQG